jgi:hypothetical protein
MKLTCIDWDEEGIYKKTSKPNQIHKSCTVYSSLWVKILTEGKVVYATGVKSKNRRRRNLLPFKNLQWEKKIYCNTNYGKNE